MLARVVVAELRGPRQALQDLDARPFQLPRPLAHPLLEQLVLTQELELEEARLEQVLDAQQHLRHVERLAQEVLRPARERAPPHVRADVTGQHQDGHVRAARHPMPQVLQHGEAVHVRHVEVQEHDVRLELEKDRQRVAGIRRALVLRVAGTVEDPLEEPDVVLLIVDHQESGVVEFGQHTGSSISVRARRRAQDHRSPRKARLAVTRARDKPARRSPAS